MSVADAPGKFPLSAHAAGANRHSYYRCQTSAQFAALCSTEAINSLHLSRFPGSSGNTGEPRLLLNHIDKPDFVADFAIVVTDRGQREADTVWEACVAD